MHITRRGPGLATILLRAREIPLEVGRSPAAASSVGRSAGFGAADRGFEVKFSSLLQFFVKIVFPRLLPLFGADFPIFGVKNWTPPTGVLGEFSVGGNARPQVGFRAPLLGRNRQIVLTSGALIRGCALCPSPVWVCVCVKKQYTRKKRYMPVSHSNVGK